MMNEAFRQELIESGYIHAPLPLHEERSIEHANRAKTVLDKRPVWPGDAGITVSHEGIGRLLLQDGRIRMNVPTERKNARDESVDESAFTRSRLLFTVPGQNWEAFNRLRFLVRPDCNGGHAVHLRLHITNAGKIPVPDPHFREGQHLVNLKNHEWNEVIWEFDALPRDVITSLDVTADADGTDQTTSDAFDYEFCEFELQKVPFAEKEHGWDCDPRHIAYSMSGYHTGYRKIAVLPGKAVDFRLENEAGETVLSKKTECVSAASSEFCVADFTEIDCPGLYRVVSGALSTELFEIGSNVMESAIWKEINFFFCERCGYAVPGKHGRCHTDVVARHNGKVLSCGGGWHDAGDMSQQMLQTAETAQELLELAHRITESGQDPLLAARVREEGLWGLEFTLRSRFGDGFRASSAGLGQWTRGYIGDADDVEYRVHNQAFQNYFCSAVEAQAAVFLKETDPDLAWKCLDAAKEDYRFAKARFTEKGMEKPIMWEHTLNSGLSQYYAAAVWACASICLSEKDPFFEEEAKRIAEKLLSCQETGNPAVPMKGFFYRDERHQTIVHFTHQGRDHSFVQAIETLLRAFPDAAEKPRWEESLKLYGEYIKAVFGYAAPYGMLPAGIHHISEAEDAETFELLHLLSDYQAEKENYKEQLKNGIDLGNGYYLRMFPVWFSFRGNNAVLLAMAKAASIVGRYFNDRKLLEIAMDQLYWISGLNPFCQSLMYGEGQRYAQQDANYPGEMTGEIPVGIETLNNEDVPYWPAGTNATYKEVWLTPAGRWLSVAADLYPDI